MEFRVNYTLIGLFVLVLSAAFISIILWMTSGSRKVYDTYLVYMNEAVSGLNAEAPVKFNGVDVGYVDKISLNPDNPQQVQLLLKILRGTPITQSTTATLTAQGITGLTYIGLAAREAHSPPLKETPNSPYPIIKAGASILVEASSTIRDAATNLKAISNSFQEVFNQKNQQAISQSLTNIAEFTHNLAQNSSAINMSLKNTQQFLQSATQTSQQLALLGQQSTATMQTFSQQALPNLLEAMQQLKQILGNMQQLSNELSNNPSLLIRGKAPLPLGPGE